MLVAKKGYSSVQYQERNSTNLQKHRKAQVFSVAVKLKMIGAVLICALAAIAVIAHYTYVVDVMQQVELATSELVALQEEGKHLELEIASLRTPQRLEKKAYEIGMQYPGREQMIILTAQSSDN